MPAVVHLVSAGAVIGDAVVDDVLALDGGHDGAVSHVVVAGADSLGPDDAARLGHRLKTITGPGARAGWRDVALLDDLGRLLREQVARHGATALHAHGPHARTVASVIGPAVGVAVVVDAGDARPAHRLLPPPSRTTWASHGDLDRGLEDGAPARDAAIVPPGVDRVATSAVDDSTPMVVIDASVATPWVTTAFGREGFTVVTALSAAAARSARLVIVGATAHLSQAVAIAVAAGVPCVAVAVPWADEFVGCAGFHALDGGDVDLDVLLRLARGGRRKPRKLGRHLGRQARTEALDELYGSLIGPRFMRHPPRRQRR